MSAPQFPHGEAGSGDPPAETIRFPVAGMTCGSCVSRITREVRRLDGVTKVCVDLRREVATVCREPALVSNAELAAAVARAGYEADMDALTPVSADWDRDRGPMRQLLERLRGTA